MNNWKNVQDKKRGGKRNNDDKQRKNTFDKKKYRLQKYSNKYRVEQWEEKRKKAVLRGFYKELQKDQQYSGQTFSHLENASTSTDRKTSNKGNNPFHRAKWEYEQKVNEKKMRHEEAARIKSERTEALKKYKEKKIQNFKVLSRRTKKGQPVMKGRAELLLQRIQQSLS